MSRNSQKGFTLIELMIVVAIIGILTSIAIPSFQDYVIRSKLIEVTTFSGAAKNRIWEDYLTHGDMPSDSSATADALQDMMTDSYYVSTALYSKVGTQHGRMHITLVNLGLGTTNDTIIFNFTTDDTKISFDCSGGTLPNKYRTKSCKTI